MTNERIVDCGVKAVEEDVIEVELKLTQLITVRRQLINKCQLFVPIEIDAGISATPRDLLGSDRAEIGKRFVIVDWPDVITPPIGEVRATLGQEQQVMCSSRGNRL